MASAEQVPRSREQIRLSFAPVARDAAPAVVNIYSRRAGADSPLADFLADPFFDRFLRDLLGPRQPQRRSQTSLGSGVVVRGGGLSVTNYHVGIVPAIARTTPGIDGGRRLAVVIGG